MLTRLLYAVRSALPVPPDEVDLERLLDRRLSDDADELAPLDEAMLEKLAEVDPRESTDPDIHVVICGMRYGFVGSALRAIYNTVRKHGQSSRFNAGQLLILRSDVQQMKRTMWLMLLAICALGVIELFGRDKGLDLLTRFAERWIGI